MRTIYADASFDHRHTLQTEEPFVRGKIAIATEGHTVAIVEKVAIGKVPNLKQYINVLELTAVARAVEYASQQPDWERNLAVYTDSLTAMFWARKGKIKATVCTLAHTNALEYLARSVKQFGGIITFNHVVRDLNPAGKLLEVELEREVPHAK